MKGTGRGKPGRRRFADDADIGKEYDLFNEEYCPGKGKIRSAGEGRGTENEFYPLTESMEKDRKFEGEDFGRLKRKRAGG